MIMQTSVQRPIAAVLRVCTLGLAVVTLTGVEAYAGSTGAFQVAQRSTPSTGIPGRFTTPPKRVTPTPGGGNRNPGGGNRNPGGSSGLSTSQAIGIGIGILGAINSAQPPRATPQRATPQPRRTRAITKRKTTPRPKKKKTVRRTPRRATPPPVLQTIPQFLPNEVLVLMAPNQPDTVGNAIAQTFNLTFVESNQISLLGASIFRFRYTDNRPLPQVIAALTANPRVESVQPNNWYQSAAGRKKKKTTKQYALAKLGIARAHELAQGHGVPIAVIDTGVDATHPTLAKSIHMSFDAVGDGKPKVQNHGTAIAGVIAGQGQIKGVAPMAQVLAARAFYMHGKYKRPMTNSMILLKAIDWSYGNGARVFNMSFAGPYDPMVKTALDRVHESGAILVAAAGNGGPKAPPAYPAAYSNVIAITAHDARDKLYPQANRGNHLVVAAPGVNVFVPKLKKSYGFSSGTSVAAAHVSGVVALLLEQHPNATSDAILQAIKNSAHDLGPKGFDAGFGAGRADAYASLLSMTGSEVKLTSGQ